MWLPAELPAIISATRSQQFRWNKGGAENFSKMRDSSTIYWIETKAHGMFHLLNSTMFLAIFTMLSVPMLYIKMSLLNLKKYLTNLLLSLPSSFISYWALSKYSWRLSRTLNTLLYLSPFTP
jgi:hypothetical protein